MFNINHRIVFMLLHSRCDVPSVYIQIVFCKHAAYVPQTLTLSNRIVFKVIVLLKVNHAASGYGQVFIPIYRDMMQITVASPFTYILQMLLCTIAVGVYLNGGVIADGL